MQPDTERHRLGLFRARLSSCALFVALMLTIGPARTEEAKARLGRVMWSAFECATFAGMAKREKEATRLSEIGLKAGRDFIEALKSGNISQEEFSTMVPMGVTMLVREGVPSTDFVIGRVYSAANEHAYESIVKEDGAGMPLDMKYWIMDDGVQKTKAETSYLRSNCELVK